MGGGLEPPSPLRDAGFRNRWNTIIRTHRIDALKLHNFNTKPAIYPQEDVGILKLIKVKLVYMKMKKTLMLVVVVLVVVLGYWLMGRDGNFLSDNMSPGEETAMPSNSPAAKTPAKKSAAPTSVPTSLRPYGDLVKEYEGKRIQFDERCQMVPSNSTYKNGTNIMLDNRSSNPVSVKVGTASYSLIGYGYQIINLSSSSLPKEMTVSCGTAGNVGKILLQARLNQ